MITSQYFNITSDASIFVSNRHISNKQHCAVWVKSLTNVWNQIPYNDYDLVNNSIILDTALLSTIYSQVELRVTDSQEELGTPVTDISTTASIRDEVIVVADNIDSITTVSDNITNLNNIADNIVKAGVVADNIADVNNVADNIVSVSSLASIRTQLESLYADKAKLTSIYNDKITLDSIYSDKSKLDAIFSDLTAIEGLYNIKAKLESIYADKSKLDSIYADKTQLDTIYNNISNILTVYGSIANVITVSNNIASVNTTASNIVDVNTFSSKYKISSTQPSSPTAGDLWYDTVTTVLKYYNGSSYVAVSPDITLLLTNTKFISNISIGNTTLSGWTNSFSVIEGQGGTFFASNGIATLTGSNCYYDGVNWKYKVNGTAGLQLVNQGTHTFRTAISGTAGSNITWVTQAIIDSNGITVSNKQDTLVSGTNIKTINSSTILGSGNINLVDLTTAQSIGGVKTFTSSPIVPTPTAGDNSTKVATTAYVDGKMKLLTAVNSTSGTSIDFTGIPSWVKRITVMFSGVSTSGTSQVQVQIGSGTVATSGYSTITGVVTTSAANATLYSSGFVCGSNISDTTNTKGSLIISNLVSNVWVAQGVFFSRSDSSNSVSGDISLSGVLDRVRITTVNGANTFDAGQINIIYEG